MNDGEKYASLDALMKDFYHAISFAPGEEPDWHCLRLLFLPGASVIPPREPGSDHTRAFSLEQFIEYASDQMKNKPDMSRQGFREKEIARRTESWDTLVHVLSTYTGSFWDGDETVTRGLNSMQVLLDDGRWWITGIIWSNETEHTPLPDRYLRSEHS